MNPVQNEPDQISTGATSNPAQREFVSKSRSPYTQVPHELLRGFGNFSDPMDFMVYLHLYSYSWGFSRETASMSQGQLEQFTGAARNTVRRSIERLIKQGWIKMVEEYECARMSRKWKVIPPEQNKKRSGSISNPVQTEPSPDLPEGGSNMNPVTGSKKNPYKERDFKEKSKNSLSGASVKIKEYLESIQAYRKRETERGAYLGLKQSFSDAQIERCLQFLRNNGAGKNEVCHSPMAYLASAIEEVLQKAESADLLAKNTIEREKAEIAARLAKEESEQCERKESEEREKAFLNQYKNLEEQKEAIAKYSIEMLGLNPNGQAARSVAILNWWNSKTHKNTRS
jgi:hypothetical protein